MLTYKLINTDDNIYTFYYYPYGKDIKIKPGKISINSDDLSFSIIDIAELDEKLVMSDNEKEMIFNHINSLREESNHPLINESELSDIIIEYKFAEKFIHHIFDQIKENKEVNKGIVI